MEQGSGVGSVGSWRVAILSGGVTEDFPEKLRGPLEGAYPLPVLCGFLGSLLGL